MDKQSPRVLAGRIRDDLTEWIGDDLRTSSGEAVVQAAGIRATHLAADTLGLLRGIENGTINSGVPRLRDNLIELAELIGERAKAEGMDESTVEDLPFQLTMFVQRIAAAGLSVNGSFPGRVRSVR